MDKKDISTCHMLCTDSPFLPQAALIKFMGIKKPLHDKHCLSMYNVFFDRSFVLRTLLVIGVVIYRALRRALVARVGSCSCSARARLQKS